MRVRTCPRCEKGLRRKARPSKAGLLETDECASCGGMFLDAGELSTLTGEPQIEGLLRASLSNEGDADFGCPSCGETMTESRLESSDVVVDACDACHGVWLDRGEMALLATFAQDGDMGGLTRAFASLAAPPGARRR